MDITYQSKDMTKTTYIGNAVTRDPIGFLAKIVGLETFLPELRKRDDALYLLNRLNFSEASSN